MINYMIFPNIDPNQQQQYYGQPQPGYPPAPGFAAPGFAPYPQGQGYPQPGKSKLKTNSKVT